MAETVYMRGEGGKVWTMDLPLAPELEKQAAAGVLVRVNKDGSPYVEKPAEKSLTPKERLQAEAAALGLDTDGTIQVLTDRIDAKVAELRKQAEELGVDDDQLTAPELLAAIDAKLGE